MLLLDYLLYCECIKFLKKIQKDFFLMCELVVETQVMPMMIFDSVVPLMKNIRDS